MARLSSIMGIGTGLLTLAFLAIGGSKGLADEPAKAGDPGPAKPQKDGEQKGRGPTLQGRIADEVGRPLRGAKVILYAGAATRWKTAEAESDADGRYRFETVRSSLIKNDKEDRWDLYVGLRIEHPTHVEADGQSWRDIRIPGVEGHVETLDFRMTPAGHVEGTLKDAKSGQPLKGLDLRIMQPIKSHGHGVTFSAYAKTDDQGRFRSISLFPGEYDVEANSSTLDYPLLGRMKVEPGRTTPANLDVSLPEVVEGRVVDANGKPIDGVEVTILAPENSDVDLRVRRDLLDVRSRAWTIYRPAWQDRFELARLPGLEKSRFVMAMHKELGWAKVSIESLAKGEPIRLQPW